ncbi:MAG: hypothetical protein V4672_17270 [Verrucomicrobiota bacterium]
MSGLIGHTLYAELTLREALRRNLPFAALLQQHQASFHAGSYLGSDIQAMPEAICVDTGNEVGFGTVPLERSPLTGGAVRQFKLPTPTGPLTATQVHERYYGRSHLVFGWTAQDRHLHVPWDHLPDYFAAVIEDLLDQAPQNQRALAYTLGWIVHIVSDSLIKGIRPGIELELLDGRYTRRNRPVQDLVSFHEIGIRELSLDWPALLQAMAATPVESVQLLYMRSTEATGHLARLFPDGWEPQNESTLHAILAENRRYLKQHTREVLADLQLRPTPAGPACSEALSQISGLTYNQMCDEARRAQFRPMLDTMTSNIHDMLDAVGQRCPKLGSQA